MGSDASELPEKDHGSAAPTRDLVGDANRLAALSLVREGTLYDLDCGRWPGMPGGGVHPPFQVIAYRTPRGMHNQKDQAWLRQDEVNLGLHTEVLIASVHTGTHIDALSHVTTGQDDHWFDGAHAESDYGDFGPLKYDATSIPPLITRGVLIDVAGERGVMALEAETPICATDLESALAAQGTSLRAGNIALIRTGYLGVWPDIQSKAHKGAGITLDAAEFLMEAGCVAVGSDTEALEQFPSPDPRDPLPVHVRMLAERGVYILEMVYCEDLARDKVYEFCFISLPLKIRGATGSFLRPVALV